MKILVELTDAEYSMLKSYAAALRKHEVGKGYRVEHAIAHAISIGLESISETIIVDKSGNPVDWKKSYCNDDETSLNRTTKRIYK